jgi:protein tyrosine/serine phosphatase
MDRTFQVSTILALGALGVLGCDIFNQRAEALPQPAGNGIPNFRVVDAEVYRGGQPTAEGWAYLKSRGVKTVVKLDLISEGSDEAAANLGMTVVDASGPPSSYLDVYGAPKPERIRLAVSTLQDENLRPVFVHCLHGQDRTGLIVGLFRVLTDHYPKPMAYKEMRENGFHPALHGLHEIWENFDGKSLPAGRPESNGGKRALSAGAGARSS